MQSESRLLLDPHFLQLGINSDVIAFQLLNLRAINLVNPIESFHILLQQLDSPPASTFILFVALSSYSVSHRCFKFIPSRYVALGVPHQR